MCVTIIIIQLFIFGAYFRVSEYSLFILNQSLTATSLTHNHLRSANSALKQSFSIVFFFIHKIGFLFCIVYYLVSGLQHGQINMIEF